ncbi:MAG TPA: DMT family transporter [Nocardioidaceae bacterium]|nr:DMT family transporter [Nocardioidaceae bacterium]
MTVVLSLVAALAYGLSDFTGGLVSRRTSAWSVAVVGSSTATVCTAVIAALAPGSPRAVDFAWAGLAGLGSGAGAGFLYRGFAGGRMGVVAPVSAVGAAVIPLVVGVLTGDRPTALAWLGIIAALPGIWLVSREPSGTERSLRGGTAAGLVDGLLAGVGFGLLFAALGQVPDTSGLWPLAFTQLVSVPAVALLATVAGGTWVPRARAAWWAILCGALGTAATGGFLLATQAGSLAIAGVLTSLYPASTVLLAALVLREHVHRTQASGLVLCAAAVVLVAAG